MPSLKALAVGRYEGWSPEVAMRYLPLLPHLGPGLVVEVGSGSIGVCPYLGRSVVGVDPDVGPDHHPALVPVRASGMDLPFRSGSIPSVLCVDALEHIDPTDRRRAVEELVRVTGGTLVIAVPAGPRSEANDRELAEHFERRRGYVHPYFADHLRNGLPAPDDLLEWVRAGAPDATVTATWNSNLRVRSALMRMWARSTRPDLAVQLLLNRLHPLLRRASFGQCYRFVVIARFPQR